MTVSLVCLLVLCLCAGACSKGGSSADRPPSIIIDASTNKTGVSGLSSSDDADPNYNARGLSPNREFSSMLPNERVDPFTGNLSISLTPISLPQNGGWDFKLTLSYNSKLHRDRFLRDIAEDSWVGVGWSLHVGRLIAPRSASMEIEMPDGSSHKCYSKHPGDVFNSAGPWVTREGWLVVANTDGTYTLTLNDGMRYVFSSLDAVIVGITSPRQCCPATSIVDTTGNTITITYKSPSPQTLSGRQAFIETITDTCGRTIAFTSTTSDAGPSHLDSIAVGGRTYRFTYDAVSESVGSPRFKLLRTFIAPEDKRWEFAYHVTRPLFELKEYVTPTGARATFSYATVNFADPHALMRYLPYRCVSSKTLSGDCAGGVWKYTYLQGNTTYVEGPFELDGSTPKPECRQLRYTFHGYPNVGRGTFYLTGMLENKQVCANRGGTYYKFQEETYAWDRHPVLENPVYGTGHDDDIIYEPVLKGKRTTRWTVYPGGNSAEQVNSITYGGYETDPHGHPTTITEQGDRTRTTDLTYWYNEADHIIDDKHVETQVITVGNEKITNSFTYNPDGTTRARTMSGVTTTYGYQNGNLTSVTDASGRVTTYTYQNGRPRTINKGGLYTEVHDIDFWGNVQQATNGRGFSTFYAYDGLGRLKAVTPPAGDAISYTYARTGTYVKRQRGSHVLYTLFDSLGRTIGTCDTGSGVRKEVAYDSLGRKIFASHPYRGSYSPADRAIDALYQEVYDPDRKPEAPQPPVVTEVIPGADCMQVVWTCPSRDVFFNVRLNGHVYEALDYTSAVIVGLQPSTAYAVEVQAVSWYDSSCASPWASGGTHQTGSADTTPPPPPSNLSARADGTIVWLTWDENVVDDLQGYFIEYSIKGSQAWNQLANPGFPGMLMEHSCLRGMTSWRARLQPDTVYEFRMRAVDHSRNESADTCSNAVTTAAQ
ncbi:MAG TPA: hypothetical protein PKM41_03395 [Deltaproteobacteria bacterium]|nr:hypothetical protein [Deltaproteobacteria bacterium]HOI06468.1 hypothetical protein [Deltaproteobacteria bacterium]